MQRRDKSGTGGSQAAGPGPPPHPQVQDKLLPMQGTRWDEGTGVAQPGTSGKEGRAAEGCKSVQWGHCATRPGLGLLPRHPAGLSAQQINLSSASKAQTCLSKALCSAQSSRTGRQQSGFTFASSHWDRSKAAAPEPAAVPCPRHCPGASLLSRDGKRLPNARIRHTPPSAPAPTGQFSGTGWSQTRRCSGSLQAGSVCSLSSHPGSKMCPSISGHTSTRGLRREHNCLAKSQGHASSQNPSWERTRVF